MGKKKVLKQYGGYLLNGVRIILMWNSLAWQVFVLQQQVDKTQATNMQYHNIRTIMFIKS